MATGALAISERANAAAGSLTIGKLEAG